MVFGGRRQGNHEHYGYNEYGIDFVITQAKVTNTEFEIYYQPTDPLSQLLRPRSLICCVDWRT